MGVRRYLWDQVLDNPSWGEVERSIGDAVAFVNATRRRGRIPASNALDWWNATPWDAALLSQEPFVWDVATATPTFSTYREGAAVFGVAWWVYAPDRYMLRVVSEDVHAKWVSQLRERVRPFGLTDAEFFRVHPAMIVCPDLYIPPVPRKAPGLLGQVGRAIRKKPFVAFYRQHYADLCEEAGALEAAKAARQALLFLEHLGPSRGAVFN